MIKQSIGMALLLLLALGCGQSDSPSSDGSASGGNSTQANNNTTSGLKPPPSTGATGPQGDNQRFFEVQKKLDEGGDFYLYWSVKDALRNTVGEIQDLFAGGQGMPPEAQMASAAVDMALGTLGLYDIEDIGISVLRDEGMAISKTFIRTAGDKKGVFKLLGGEAHPFDSLKYAPQDAVLFTSVDLDAAQGLALVREFIGKVGGIPQLAEFNQQLAMAGDQAGLDIEGFIQSLGGEFLFVSSFHPTQRIAPPDPELGGLSFPSPQVALGIRVKNSLLYDQLTSLLVAQGAPLQDVSVGDLKKMTLAMPPNNIYPVDPVLAFDGEFVFLTTHSGYLDKMMAAKAGGANLSGHADFKKMMETIPASGNGISYFSPQAAEELKKLLGQLVAIPEIQQGSEGMAELLIGNAVSVASASVTVRVNDTAGLYIVGKSGANSPTAAAAVIAAPVVAVLAAIAIPNFLEFQTRAKVSRTMSDMRSMATGLEAYMVDWGQYPPAPECITTPIAYLTSLYPDPFSQTQANFNYTRKQYGWITWSMGPDRQFNMTPQMADSLYNPALPNPYAQLIPYMYDPTNGTTSMGDIMRIRN